MRKIDVSLGRSVLLEIALPNGQAIQVRKPVLRQLLEHEYLRADMLQGSTEARQQEDFKKLAEVQMDYMVNEIRVFVPEIEREHVLELTEDQRLEIMRAVRPDLYPQEEAVVSDDPPQENPA